MTKLMQRVADYREYGPRCSRMFYRNRWVIMWASPRFFGSGKRMRPMLAWECRREGGILWANLRPAPSAPDALPTDK